MEMRRYKDTNNFVSLLGFGAMRLPRISEEGQEIDVPKAMEMVDYAIAHGVNYFDTAYGYHGGLSEPFLREALSRYPREKWLLADKLPLWLLEKEEDVLRIFREQLERCGVRYFDHYLLHNITQQSLPAVERFRVYEQLIALKKNGAIRRLGFSLHDVPEVLEEVVRRYDWDFAQIQLNYLDWDEQDAKRQYRILTERGIPVIVMEPLRGGTLTALSGEAESILREARADAGQASWGLRFAGSLPNVLTVLSGMTEPEQVRDNVATMENFAPLSNDEYDVLERVVAASRLDRAIPCTACRYCMDCPSGVDIPKVFGAYNAYLSGYKGMTNSWGDAVNFSKDYRMIGTDKQAHHCIACGVCVSSCPQRIDIPGQMATIAAFAAGL